MISFSAAVGQSNRAFSSIVQAGALAVALELDATMNAVEELGTNPALYDFRMSTEELTEYLQTKATQYGFVSFYATNTNGKTIDGHDFSTYDFYKTAIKGQSYISAPQITTDKSASHIMVAAPIWQDGIRNSEVIGTICAVVDGKLLSDIVSKI